MKRTLVLAAVSALVIGLTVSLPAGDLVQVEQVKIDNFSFTPQVLTIKAGTSVTWTNKDDVPHTVVSTSKKFASGCSTPMTGFHLPSTSRAPMTTTVPYTRT